MSEPVVKPENEVSEVTESPSACLEKMRAAFAEQINDELYATATKYAAARADGVARAGGRVDGNEYARDLVQGALVATYAGVLDWDPDRATLEQHVMYAIKCRSRHDRRHVAEFEMISLDFHDQNDVSAIRTDTEAALTASGPDPVIAARLSECLVRLRELAVGARD